MEVVTQGPVVVVRLCFVAFSRQSPAYGPTNSELVCKCQIEEKEEVGGGGGEDVAWRERSHGSAETRVLIIKQRKRRAKELIFKFEFEGSDLRREAGFIKGKEAVMVMERMGGEGGWWMDGED
jgi:hypothetical protein